MVFLATILNAQLTIDGLYRPRTEFNHGYKTIYPASTMFNLGTSHRARVGITFKKEKYSFGLQVQDVRTWGTTAQLALGDGAATTVHQAWADMALAKNLSLKVGRMELNYDDMRILGSVDWTQQGRSHDLALFKYEKKDGMKLHFGTAVNQVQTIYYGTVGNYKSMQFLWFNKTFGNYKLSLLALNNGLQSDTTGGKPVMTKYSQIFGQRSEYKKDKLFFGFNTYVQMGEDAASKEMMAYNIGLDLKYQLNEKISVQAGFEMLSGTSQIDTANKVNNSFNPLYGTNHKFNGHMDYFYVGNHLNTVGLNDAFIGMEYKKGKFDCGFTAHYFMAAADVMDKDEFAATGNYKATSSALGMELDLFGGYKLTDDVDFKAGISFMSPTETLISLRNGNDQSTNYWAFMMFVVKPSFLK